MLFAIDILIDRVMVTSQGNPFRTYMYHNPCNYLFFKTHLTANVPGYKNLMSNNEILVTVAPLAGRRKLRTCINYQPKGDMRLGLGGVQPINFRNEFLSGSYN